MDAVIKQSRFHSIKTELILWFLLLSLLPIVLVAGISYSQSNKTLNEAASYQLTQSANANLRFIQNWFDYRFMDISNQAKDKHNIDLVSQFHESYLNSELKLADYVLSKEWQIVTKSSHNELSEFINNYDYIYDLLLIDIQGNIVYTVLNEEDLGTNLITGRYATSNLAQGVRHSLKTGQTEFTDIEHYPLSNNLISGFLTSPLIDKQQKIVGVLAVQISLNRIFTQLDNKKGNEIKHFVVAEDRTLRTPINNNREVPNLKLENLPEGYLRDINNSSSKEPELQEPYIYPNWDDKKVIGISHKINLPLVNWYLVSEIEESVALAPAIWLGNLLLWLVCIIGLLVVSVTLIIARRITTPISELAKATQKVAQGELDIQINVENKNELGQLAEAFNRMIFKRRLFEHNLDDSNRKISTALAELAEQKYALDQHSIVSVTNLDGEITYVNDKFCITSGYSATELIGQDHKILSSGFHKNEFLADMLSTISKGFVWQGEICNKRKDGVLFWVDTTIVPFMDEEERPQSYVVIRTDITRQKTALKRLAESEERYHLAMSVANDGIWDWDMASDQVIFDDRYYTMAGYRAEEFPQEFSEWEKRVHPADVEKAKEALKNYLKGEVLNYEIEFRFKRKDDSYMWISGKGEFVAYDNQGHPIRMLGTHSDITKRKIASKALQKNEAILLLAQKSAKIGHYSYDTLSANWSCSEALDDIFGIDKNYSKNLTGWFQVIHPSDRKLMAKYLQEHVLRDHNRFDIEYRIIDIKTKKEKWVHGIGTLKFDSENNPVEMFGTIQDITQSKVIEVELQNTTDRQKLLVDTIPYGVQESDLDGVITFVNKACCRILNRSKSELVGKYLWDFELDDSHREKLKSYFKNATNKKQQPTPYIATKRTPKGDKIITESVWDYQRNSSGELLGYIAILSDITNQKKSEKALQRAQKMEAIGQLTGGIAHDFNNILGVIIGNLDLLDSQFGSNAKAQKRIASASKAVSRAENLTKQLLGFSREKVTESKVSNVNRLIKGMDDVIRHSLGQEIITCYSLFEDIWLTKIDRGDLQDALLNTLLNAKDAVGYNGKISIETKNIVLDDAYCEINNGSVPGEFVQVSISDNGEGISKEDIGKVFEPFFTTKAQGKGTGLGLSMVFGFVKRSGGYIEVQSKRTTGTTFKIYLPRCISQIEDIGNKKPSEMTDLNLEGNEAILIVDDEIGLVELATSTLEKLGYDIFTAENAQQALEIIDNNRNISLLFSDIVMPGRMSGFDLAKAVQTKYPALKILLSSGFIGKASTSNDSLNANYDILSKPYAQNEMVVRIRKLLNLNRNKDIFNLPANNTQDDISPVEWKTSFSIGVKAIDDDHRQLISMLNNAMNLTQADNANCKKLLTQLVDFTQSHFQREESVMQACNFPSLENHKQVHKLLLKRVYEMASLEESGQLTPIELYRFLSDWLVEHIQIMDLEIKPYCKGNLEKIDEALRELSQISLSEKFIDENSELSDTKSIRSAQWKWNESMKIGSPAIDDDHKQLLLFVGRLNNQNKNEDGSLFVQTLRKFITLAKRHFQVEEMILNICDYPHIIDHKQVHRLLLKQLKDKHQQFLNKVISSNQLMSFLKVWLIDHILGLDGEIELDFNNKQAEIEEALKTFEHRYREEGSL